MSGYSPRLNCAGAATLRIKSLILTLYVLPLQLYISCVVHQSVKVSLCCLFSSTKCKVKVNLRQKKKVSNFISELTRS